MPVSDDRLRGGTKGDTRRAERLAAELRENLKRRKTQSRNRKAGDDDLTAATEPVEPTDETAAELPNADNSGPRQK